MNKIIEPIVRDIKKLEEVRLYVHARHKCKGKLINTCHGTVLLLTLGACASEGYSSWSVCVCLSGRDKLLRSLTPARYSAYRL